MHAAHKTAAAGKHAGERAGLSRHGLAAGDDAGWRAVPSSTGGRGGRYLSYRPGVGSSGPLDAEGAATIRRSEEPGGERGAVWADRTEAQLPDSAVRLMRLIAATANFIFFISKRQQQFVLSRIFSFFSFC